LAFALLAPGAAAAQQGQGAPVPGPEVQGSGLAAAAARAQEAWVRHDAAGIVASTPKVLVQLPGAEPAAALDPAQAAALLGDYIAPADELSLRVAQVREIPPDRGYVELQRRFRVRGTQEVRTQSLLFGWRRAPAGWQLAELRIVE
jgi:hypothetical protein